MTVRPVTPDRWPDLARLFEARGGPHYCWCMVYRSRSNHTLGARQRRGAMEALVATGTPVGLLAYAGDESVAWCSVAPRETYPRLARSRTMPPVGDAPTWTVLCFFVRRDHRGRGVTRSLLRAAVAYAKAAGAHAVEGYPFDTAGVSSTHRGHSSVFRAAGFRREGRRWVWVLVPRRRAAGPERS